MRQNLNEHTSMLISSPAFIGLSAEILSLGKTLRFQASGSSMQPLVRDGDVLLIKPVDPQDIRLGDIVLCQGEGERVVVHRVIRKRSKPEGLSFQIQGDQAAQPDGWIPAGSIYGRLVAIDREDQLIDMEKTKMRFLGWLAAQRSKWQLGKRGSLQPLSQLIKHLPIFKTYLSEEKCICGK